MKFIHFVNGKEQLFKWDTKQAEEEYVEVCTTIWGGIPTDVNWAIEKPIYKNALFTFPEQQKNVNK